VKIAGTGWSSRSRADPAAHPSIRQAVVLALPAQAGTNQLVAYLIPQE